MNNREKFNTDAEYRKEVIRELESSGTIEPMDNKEFGLLVWG